MAKEIKVQEKSTKGKEAGPQKKKRASVKKNVVSASKSKNGSRSVSRRVNNEEEFEGSRRNTLIQERDEELWLNKRLTTKGNVVDWYLAPESHEPFWTNRKIRAVHPRHSKKPILTSKQRMAYERIKLGHISTDFVFTQGELMGFERLFRKDETVEKKKPEISEDLSKILSQLKEAAPSRDVGEEPPATPKEDGAKAYEEWKEWTEGVRDADVHNQRLVK